MNLTTAGTRDLRSAEEVIADYRAVRARLWPKAKPVTRIPVAPPVVPDPPEPKPEAQPRLAAPVSPRVYEIIDAVAAGLHITREAVMFGLDPIAQHGRRIAIALVIHRLDIPMAVVGRDFGVAPEVPRIAMRMVNPTLIACTISARAPLAATVSIVLKAGTHDPNVTVDDIKRAVCAAFGVRMIDLISDRRTADIVKPRQIVMALAKHLTTRSLPDIGQRLGGRDHTTVLHAIHKLAPYIAAVAPKMGDAPTVSDWVVALREAWS